MRGEGGQGEGGGGGKLRAEDTGVYYRWLS